jgi:hypothetical protein
VIFGATDGAFAQTAVDQLGTSGSDVMSDGGVARTLVAGAGKDTLTATVASVLYGGAGDDTFDINDKMITALQKPLGSDGNVGQLARIDGGAGIDKIVLSGKDLTFDLTKITGSAMNPEGVSRLNSIEEINITGSGTGIVNNTLVLTAKDVLDMGGKTNVYDFGGSSVYRELIITGNAGDTVDLADVANSTTGWTKQTAWALFVGTYDKTVDYGGSTYKIWESDSTNMIVLVQKDMTVI